MKKIFLIMSMFALMSTFTLRAQVTIGSHQAPDTHAVLDLQSKDSLGLLLPRVTLTDTVSSSPTPITANVRGMLVYNTNTSADGQVIEGVYYNDGRRWWLTGAGGASPWLISATTAKATSNTDNIYQMGQVAIGTASAPDPTAVLNVEATDKGVLLPRVSLSSSTDSTTIHSPTKGLLVYNTGANANFSTVGYMYWNGARWALFAAGTADAAHATLSCAGATLSPSITVTGGTDIPAGALLQIPYSVSNGGMFNGATLVSTGNPNVTATIGSNVLMQGSGVLSFLVQGTPTTNQEAPTGLVFDLTPFLDANPGVTGCNSVTVGNILTASITSTAVMGYLKLGTDEDGSQTYFLSCNSPDGKYSIRVAIVAYTSDTTYKVAYGNQRLNVQLRNNQNSSTWIIWNMNTDYGAALSGAGVLNVPSKVWGGQTADTGGTWTNYSYWGNIGIYDSSGSGPEYRRYTWIPQGANNKVSYEAKIMAALDTSTPTTAVSPTLVKVYFTFQQVTAQ